MLHPEVASLTVPSATERDRCRVELTHEEIGEQRDRALARRLLTVHTHPAGRRVAPRPSLDELDGATWH